MPSSPRWAQHTSRCSGARSAEGDLSGRGPTQGPPACAPRLHTAEGPGVRAMTLALTSRALGELAVSAKGPGHPGRATLAAVGTR